MVNDDEEEKAEALHSSDPPVHSPPPDTADDQRAIRDGDRLSAAATAAPADAAGTSYGEVASGRLSKLMPKLGHMATRAHRASGPYLTYAAMASQEAARFAADRAKRYVGQVHSQHRRGEAPPGRVDTMKVDWSGVGSRFCSLSWYERQLVENSRGRECKQAVSSKVAKEGRDGLSEGQSGVVAGVGVEGGGSDGMSPPGRLRNSDADLGIGFFASERSDEASVMATLRDLDPWVTAPLFQEDFNTLGSGSVVLDDSPFLSDLDTDGSSGSGRNNVSGNGLRDCPSPPQGRRGDGSLDRRGDRLESWEQDQVAQTPAPSPGVTNPADAAGRIEFMQAGAGLVNARWQHDVPGPVPEAERVGEPIAPQGLSASAPAATPDIARARATAVPVQGEDAIAVSLEPHDARASHASRAASGTPPTVPVKPARVTTAFLEASGETDEHLPLWNDSGDFVAGSGVAGIADAGVPGTESSQGLLLAWLRREASLGDEEAQFHLAQLFSPPRFEMKTECRECGEPFGVTRYRHHCRHCGGSFCHEHAWHEHPIPKFGLPAPQRVCTPCKRTLELEDWRERVEWRLERVTAYLEDRLIQYFDTGVDTVGDKALRVVDGAIYVAKAAPLGTAVKVSVEVMDVLMKYGTAGVAGLVLRREFVEAVDVLKRLSGVDKKWPMSVHEMTAAMYYLLAQRRGERGSDPNAEHRAHAGLPVVSDEELAFLRRMSALPLHFAYTKTALELQVLCNTTGWSLVFHKPESRFHQPAFSLLASRTTMTVTLVVRGTGSIHDVITDIQAIPVPFPPSRAEASAGEDGWSDLPPADTVACCGMARAAEWLHREVVHQLVRLHREGHEVIILGHSLGGGVAALLGILLKDVIPDVRVVAFATPACADIGVSKLCESMCTNVILHDDVVPCVTPQAVRALLKDLLCTKEGWVKHLYDDWDAVVGRAKGLWAPRWRSASFPGVTSTGLTSPAGNADDGLGQTPLGEKGCPDEDCPDEATALVKEGNVSAHRGREGRVAGGEEDAVSVAASDAGDEWGGRGKPHTVVVTAAKRVGEADPMAGKYSKGAVPRSHGAGGGGKGKDGWVRGKWPTVDVRAVQSRLSRIVDDTSARIRSNIVNKDTQPLKVPPLPPRRARVDAASGSAAAGIAVPMSANPSVDGKDESQGGVQHDGDQSVGDLGSPEEEVEVVDELPLPELYVPGRTVHIYSQRGVYRATEVPRDHSCLRTIPMYGNMLADHASLAYFDALEEVAAVRVAEAAGQVMPEWTPFSTSDKCELCKADFTWASTSKSEAQQARDKHNCRMCGLLVCGPCSDHRKPLPRFGVLAPCRVCDRCFYGADPTKATRAT